MFIAGGGPITNTIQFANVPIFMTETAVVVSNTSGSRYMIVVSMQSRNTIGTGIYLISSIGRSNNNVVPTTANAINVSNDILFGNTEIALGSTDTYLMASSSSTAPSGLGNAYSFIDQPGEGTFTYSVRVVSNAILTIRQFYINVIQVSG
jgi:hypothetical protein